MKPIGISLTFLFLVSVVLPISSAYSESVVAAPPSSVETIRPAETIKPADTTKGPSGVPSGLPSGVIDDSIVNRLAIGMSDTEVFTLAGPPKYPSGNSLPYANRWLYVVGDQFVELSFGSGHVVEIKRLQSQGGMAR